MGQNYKAFSLLKKKQKELNKSLRGRKRIYLDMNFLIEFLKNLNNLQCRPFTKELYVLLKELVRKEKVIIPISDIHLYESYKYDDQDRYKLFIFLIEELSRNICFVSFDQRWNNELVCCLRITFGIRDPYSYLNDELLTRPFFLKGDRIPVFNDFLIKDDEDTRKHQESFIEFSWEKTFSEIFIPISKEVKEKLNPKEYEKMITQYLIDGRMNNVNDYRDFIELYGKEIWGSFEISQEYIESLLNEYFKDYTLGGSVIADCLFSVKADERAIRLMYSLTESILNSKNYSVLPALSIGSGLHSLKRWEEKSKYRESDSFDIMHAQVALPYCDYFLTERNLTGLIKNSYLTFDRIFDCRVICDIEEAYNVLLNDQTINDT